MTKLSSYKYILQVKEYVFNILTLDTKSINFFYIINFVYNIFKKKIQLFYKDKKLAKQKKIEIRSNILIDDISVLSEDKLIKNLQVPKKNIL